MENFSFSCKVNKVRMLILTFDKAFFENFSEERTKYR